MTTPRVGRQARGVDRLGEALPGLLLATTPRRYQVMALDAYGLARRSGRTRSYLVLPPGAGKTLVGLEVIRRERRRALVLAPNTAVQAQWLRQWSQHVVGARLGSNPVIPGSDRTFSSALTVLTYQALAVVDRDGLLTAGELDDDTVGGQARRGTASRRARAGVLRTGGPAELLELLHPNAQDAIARAAALGPWTLVLDEAHHLLELWGGLVRALADALGPDTIMVGLTATPPVEMTGWQQQLQQELFGPKPDFSVPTPAVVKEGDLAPYQELVYLTEPTVEEDTWVAAERARFADLQVELADARLGSMPLFVWLERRLLERRVSEKSGASVSWQALEAAQPALCRAALRFVHAGMLRLPEGARLREEHRVDPDADDWVEVLVDFATHHLAVSSDERDARALVDVQRILPSLGCRLSASGRRSMVSGVERLVSLSASKAGAVAHILEVETAAAGGALRALVLCDREAASAELPASLRGARSGGTAAGGAAPLGEQAGSGLLMLQTLSAAAVDVGVAQGGAVSVPAGAAPGPAPAGSVREVGWWRPVLLTGRSVAVCQPLALELLTFSKRAHPELELRLEETDPPGVWRVVGGTGWTSRVWTPTVTEFFAQGRARVLIGTRALLGEGWDCPQVSTLIDCTEAGSGTAVVQMRGRSLRRNPADPSKVANNWTVTCVAHGHPRGDADYLRLVRKHAHHFAPAPDGTIESGIGHCDTSLSPYAPPTAEQAKLVTARSLDLAGQRALARERWRVGQGYDGVETEVLKVRSGREFGAPAQLVPSWQLQVPGRHSVRPRFALSLTAGRSALLAAFVLVGDAVGVSMTGSPPGLITAATSVLAGGLLGQRTLKAARQMADVQPSGALEQLAGAVADALHEVGDTSVGSAAVRLTVTPDGWVQARLVGGGLEQSRAFTCALDEVLAPMAEPKAIVSRVVLTRPATARGRLVLAARTVAGRPVQAAEAWHAVPSALGRNKRRRQAFAQAWERHVGPGRLLRADEPEASGVLELLRGADPFAVTSQTRTQWQ